MFGGDETELRPGRPISVIVRKVLQNVAFCSIPDLGNKEATLAKEDISSSTELNSCTDRLEAGQRIEARYACSGDSR